MSYILDALKKSERQRPPGPVPDLFTVHGPQPPTPRWPARAIVTAVLLLVAAAASLSGWFGRGDRGEGAAPSPVSGSPHTPGGSPAAPATPARAAVPPAPASPSASASAHVPPAAAALKPAGVRPHIPAPPARQAREAAAASAVAAVLAAPAPSPAVSPVTIAPAPVAPAPAPMLLEGGVPRAPAPPPHEPPSAGVPAAPPVGAPEPAAAVPAAEQAPPADGRVVDLAELPESIRAELPRLVVSGHVWSEEPSLRLMSVDDRLLHEGGEAAPGVGLREITPSGGVFAFKGWRFRVTGGQP